MKYWISSWSLFSQEIIEIEGEPIDSLAAAKQLGLEKREADGRQFIKVTESNNHGMYRVGACLPCGDSFGVHTSQEAARKALEKTSTEIGLLQK